MSKKTSYLLGILLTIIIGTLLYWFFCCKPCLEAQKVTLEPETIEAQTPEVKTATSNVFSVLDEKSSIRFTASDNFNFKASDFSILEPVSDGLKTQIERVTTYLTDNPNKMINITGHYTSEENNDTAFPNLGLARANAVKNYLVTTGLSTKLINTYGELNDSLVANDANIFQGPVSYKINTLEANDTSFEEDLKILRDNIKANPLILYFDSGAASINLTKEQRLKVSNMVRYLDKTDNASIQIIGHTDNTGSRETNIRLGKNRAEFAKTYLVKNGILPNKINTASKGPDEPIAENSTDEGKAKNRRVVVTIN
ncbi:OmpA family protein [Lacinutrix sp. MedPE-SW]|uniref:OmpA family protein n=1 Tax=Lacinutrix sp. MedPE-SW TaxID=1860087 RepID=UPI00090ECA60|nr:OmpA family protein [Lacinutrix sp. MedPE-SW]OIQ17715.1 MAG: flagellar motor protein MotB [Lacinutrix sp. MedPE-SW]